jgi:hypothetical protein
MQDDNTGELGGNFNQEKLLVKPRFLRNIKMQNMYIHM